MAIDFDDCRACAARVAFFLAALGLCPLKPEESFAHIK